MINEFKPQKKVESEEKDSKRQKSIYGNRKYHIDEDYFKNVNTEDKAYWLGFLFADGCVLKDGATISIALQRSDKNHLVKFLECIKADSNYPIKEYDVKFNGKVYKAVKITLYSRKLWNDLISLGCIPCKSLVLKPPKIDLKFANHFCRGYFDGDGSVSFNETTETSQVSVVGTKDLLEYVKINSGISDIRITLNQKGNNITHSL